LHEGQGVRQALQAGVHEAGVAQVAQPGQASRAAQGLQGRQGGNRGDARLSPYKSCRQNNMFLSAAMI
jgi:hypothetical protein